MSTFAVHPLVLLGCCFRHQAEVENTLLYFTEDEYTSHGCHALPDNSPRIRELQGDLTELRSDVDHLHTSTCHVLAIDLSDGGEYTITGDETGYAVYVFVNPQENSSVLIDPSEHWPIEWAGFVLGSNQVPVNFVGGSSPDVVIRADGSPTYVFSSTEYLYILDRHKGLATDADVEEVAEDVSLLDVAVRGVRPLDLTGGGDYLVTGEDAGYSLYLLSNTESDSRLLLDPSAMWPTEIAVLNQEDVSAAINFVGGVFADVDVPPGPEALYLSLVSDIPVVLDRNAANIDRTDTVRDQIGSYRGVPNLTTDAFTPNNSHANHRIRLGDAIGVSVTIPADADVLYSTGTVLEFVQTGAGPVTVAGDIGVNVLKRPSHSLTTSEIYETIRLVKVGADAWEKVS